MQRILVIDDDIYICTLLEKYLKKEGFGVDTAFSGKSGLAKIKADKFEVVLCDFRLPDIDGKQMLTEIKTIAPQLQVIIITGYSDVRVAVSLIKSGAYEYVTKPIYPEEILEIIKSALKTSTASPAVSLVSKAAEASPIIQPKYLISGESPKFKEVLKHAQIVAPTDMAVLIQGETGAGKEFVARTIHDQSARKDKAFIAVDCGAIPKDIANSELFGHVKGSFTGAITNKEGYFEAADGGTLFLDEIGNLSYEIQVKLLRALQEKVISKVGDNKSIKVDVRVVAATNEDLQVAIGNATFREDLYHRLNEFTINLPPLRDRKEDIMSFGKFFLQQANTDLRKNILGFDEKTTDIFLKYPWYGNLRELRNVIKRCVLLTQTDFLTEDCLPDEIRKYGAEYKQHSNYHTNSTVVSSVDQSGSLKGVSVEAEKEAIFNALIAAKYNKSKAADMLNIDRKTLYNKIKQYNIEVDL
ncbi:MAG: sigma-54-dependent transcriptional regulator [Cytophagales bacterium]